VLGPFGGKAAGAWRWLPSFFKCQS